MYYRIIADIVVILHLLFIVFVVLGGFLAIRHRKWIFIHLPAVVWAALLEFNGWLCPLTPLENWFRQMGEEGAYQGGFIEHTIEPILYPGALTRRIQIYIGILVITVNLIIYLWVICKIWKQRPLKKIG
jgi:Protein of Unknown function (DUF2784)